MKKIIKLFFVAFLLNICSHSVAQKNKTAERKIDSLFSSYNAKTPGVAIAIVKDGKVVFKKGYGMANLNYNIPVTTQTVFNIASVSKQFTAFAVYLLQNEGQLSFEDDIRKYIPELPVYETTIKIKHLLAHTSGLRDHGALQSIAGGYIWADKVTTQQALKLIYKNKRLNFAPGSMYGYSNSNFTLLAEIVHRISGQTFSAYTTEKMFKPLGMNDTYFSDDNEAVVKNKAESYELDNGKYYHKPVVEANPGPSDLLTTVEDLCKWVLNFENPKVGNKRLIENFNSISELDNGNKIVIRVIDGDSIFYAKGQNRWKHKGASIMSYGGHTFAFRSFLGRFPDQHLAIIQLSNDEHNEKLGGRWDIADYYIKDQLKETKEVAEVSRNNNAAPKPESYKSNLNGFSGKYYNDELETEYTFEVANDSLIMKHARLYDIILRQTGENKFAGSGSYTFAFDINFNKNEQGEVTDLAISNWGAKNIKFQKIK
ncbi:MAG: beta-lactamase family protein [Ferruginibacter sp.]|nr:beta-lactamase family protein [Ferruginibacter sp.]